MRISLLNLMVHDVCAVVSPSPQVGRHDVCAVVSPESTGGEKQIWTSWMRKQETGPPIHEGGRGASYDLLVQGILFSAFKHVHTLPITKCELYPRKAGPDMIEFSCVHFYGLCLLRTEMKVPFKQMSMASHEHWMSTVLHGVNWNFIFIIFSQKASVCEDFDVIRIFVGSLDSPHPCSSSPQLLSTLDSHLSPHSLNLLICPFSWAI